MKNRIFAKTIKKQNKEMENLPEKQGQNDIVIYQLDDDTPQITVRLNNETVWLTQMQLVDLYQSSKSNVSEHIKHIFEEGELDKNSVVRNFRTTASDGKSYDTTYYSLDLIISLGYRIKSHIATKFRIWATERLKEYIIKGFTMDDERLKGTGGGNYWKELLDRIRDIRSSEKALYRQVLDLYATSRDYEPKSKESIRFFKTVQNKLHYATNQQTAAELINSRADAGHVSHDQAMNKAVSEYKKYQAKTLTPVEQAYLETIKVVQKKIAKNVL